MLTILDYTIEKKLYQSPFGSEVILACGSDGKRVVLKKLDKSCVDADLLANEISAGQRLHHPNIIQMHGYFEDDDFMYLVLDYYEESCDLFGFLETRDFELLTEKDTKKIFRQIVKAVRYIHRQGIAHLDLKYDNVLIDKQSRVKVIDFGLCEPNLCHGTLVTRMCGSTDYICPEIMQQTPYCGTKADIWALGVILFGLYYSELPFSFDDRCRAIRRMQPHPELQFPSRIRDISDSLKDLISKMLAVDPTQRLGIEEVLAHPWLLSDKPKSKTDEEERRQQQRWLCKSISMQTLPHSSITANLQIGLQSAIGTTAESPPRVLFKSSSLMSVRHYHQQAAAC